MCHACCNNPLGCFVAICFPCCCGFHLRRRALQYDMSKWVRRRARICICVCACMHPYAFVCIDITGCRAYWIRILCSLDTSALLVGSFIFTLSTNRSTVYKDVPFRILIWNVLSFTLHITHICGCATFIIYRYKCCQGYCCYDSLCCQTCEQNCPNVTLCCELYCCMGTWWGLL